MCLHYCFSFDEKLSLFGLLIQGLIALGVMLAYYQYKKKVDWENKEGLHLELSIQKIKDENLILFKTKVSNRTNKNIGIEKASLIFSLHPDSLNSKKQNYQEFKLDYYTNSQENIHVSNETLRYVFPLELADYTTSNKVWDVRFVVEPTVGYKRTVHSAFKGTFSEIKINH